MVRLHDPHGHPYATLPAVDFIAAWRAVPAAESIGYAAEPFTAWTGFRRVRDTGAAAALRRALPVAARWLGGETKRPVPPGSLGGAAALERDRARVARLLRELAPMYAQLRASLSGG
jgi:hypothetical protein